MKITFILLFTLFAVSSSAQNDLTNYLENHHYSFSPDHGFDSSASDVLKDEFKNYKLILEAEGGSHSLNIYHKLPIMWIKFLNLNFGLKHFFIESGPDAAYVGNRYLQTGDSSSLSSIWLNYFRPYYQLNMKLDRKIIPFGIDFVRASNSNYVKALKLLLPKSSPSENIKSNIELLQNANDTLKDCDYILNLNSKIEEGLQNNKQEYEQYFGENFNDFERIIMIKGTCKDVYKNRNYNLAANFLSFDAQTHDSIYYGELGMAHTILKNKVAASIINNSPGFKDKVCVINLYCYKCNSQKEEVSNWPLKKIDNDIQKYFLPFCTSDFTLFDLSENNAIIKKYREYGQFLIIAKNQN